MPWEKWLCVHWGETSHIYTHTHLQIERSSVDYVLRPRRPACPTVARKVLIYACCPRIITKSPLYDNPQQQSHDKENKVSEGLPEEQNLKGLQNSVIETSHI